MSNKIHNIRNFSIIAHIDHGKSTLADRLIQMCGAVTDREFRDQILDSMDIERERGITIKAQTVRLIYSKDGVEYNLNLIDTPGHVDFSYEVSRSLSACEGSILLVDATQGTEAQTIANAYQAIEANHVIIPVINKIDLPASNPDYVKKDIENVIGIDASDAILVSAKTGIGIGDLLNAIVEQLPCPEGDVNGYLQALLVDSWYDAYMGVVILVRIKNGVLKSGMQIRMLSNNRTYVVDKVGVMTPKAVSRDSLTAGEVGFITAGIKAVADCNVGDTICDYRHDVPALEGFKKSVPVVFCSLFPSDATDFEKLRDALGKLHLNDASFVFEMESSNALGMGFRCGFLGLLHLEIIQERLDREYDLDIITTAPSVIYRVHMSDGSIVDLYNPADMPDLSKINMIEEPWVDSSIMVPDTYLGSVISLCEEKRGIQQEMLFNENRVMLRYSLPLNEIVFDFYDRLKSCSKGYASFDYKMSDYMESDLVRVDILINASPVDALSFMVHRTNSERRGRAVCEKLRDLIPRHMFKIPIQAAIGSKIIARETISAFRKDVIAHCYGGDVTRKRKLLEKQKAGKKKMRSIGSVDIPHKVFLEVLRGE